MKNSGCAPADGCGRLNVGRVKNFVGKPLEEQPFVRQRRDRVITFRCLVMMEFITMELDGSDGGSFPVSSFVIRGDGISILLPGNLQNKLRNTKLI